MIKLIIYLCKKFNILTIAVIGLIYFLLYLGGFEVGYGSVIFAITHVLVFTTLLYSFYRILVPKKNKKETRDSVKKKKKDDESKVVRQPKSKQEEKIIYYEVKQDPRYVFSEYPDRYELFLKTPSGLKYIKTDYKTKSEKK